MDGQSPSQGTPFRNLVYEEDGLRLYLIDICGELSFHIDNEIPIDLARIKHLRDIFASLLYVLSEKGWHHLDTWIPPHMENEIKFAESFGFSKTGYEKIIKYVDGREQNLTEMRITF